MFFMRTLSEPHVSSRKIYVINTYMAVSLADFTVFFQDKGELLKKVKTVINQVMLRAAATQRGS